MATPVSSLETNQVTECPFSELNNATVYDPRFTALDRYGEDSALSNVLEWQVMEENGVGQILEQMHKMYPSISDDPTA